VDPAGVGPSIWFQPVPEERVVNYRLHLDLKIIGGRSVPFGIRKAAKADVRAKTINAGQGRLRPEAAYPKEVFREVFRSQDQSTSILVARAVYRPLLDVAL
jgi:hypothetical protein